MRANPQVRPSVSGFFGCLFLLGLPACGTVVPSGHDILRIAVAVFGDILRARTRWNDVAETFQKIPC